MMMVILVLHKKGVCMKMFKVILLGVMVVMFSSVSLARNGGNKGGGQSAKSSQGASGQASKSGQPADKGQGNPDNVKPENGDKTRDQTRDPATDQTGTKKQDRDRIHTPGTGTATPTAVPATN
jgi:hypothetical protein